MSGLRRSKKGKSKLSDSNDSLKNKRKQKRKKFAWLAKFLGLRPSKNELVDKGILTPEPVEEKPNLHFGLNPQEIYNHDERLINNIPKPLWYGAEALRPWMIIEGVFRVSGVFSEMKKMKATFEDDDIPDFDNVVSRHSISGLLEMWFRELPEPITTYDLYDEFMDCADKSLDEDSRIEKLKEAIAKLPAANREVLSFFLRVLLEISKLEDENKMSTSNLGVVFGSIFLGTETLSFSLGMKEKLNNQNLIVQWFIDYVKILFPKDDEDEDEDEDNNNNSNNNNNNEDEDEIDYDYIPPPPDNEDDYSGTPNYAAPPEIN